MKTLLLLLLAASAHAAPLVGPSDLQALMPTGSTWTFTSPVVAKASVTISGVTNALLLSNQTGAGYLTLKMQGNGGGTNNEAFRIQMDSYTNASSTPFWEIAGDVNGDGQSMEFNNQGTTRLYLKTNGNVGIGTTSPGYTLDVNGAVNVSSTTHIGWERVSSNCTTCTSQNASCSAGNVVTGGGCVFPVLCTPNDSFPVTNSIWQCSSTASCSSITTYALCARIGP